MLSSDETFMFLVFSTLSDAGQYLDTKKTENCQMYQSSLWCGVVFVMTIAKTIVLKGIKHRIDNI